MSIGLNTIPAISPFWLDGSLDATGKPSKTNPAMREGATSLIERHELTGRLKGTQGVGKLFLVSNDFSQPFGLERYSSDYGSRES